VILPAPSVKESLVGDVFAPPGVALSANYPTVFGDRVGFGMINLFDRAVGAGEGEGIASVEFTVLDAAFGTVVHRATRAESDRFCAFGGSTPACAVWDFGAYGGAWPSGEPARSGRYILIATAQGTTAAHQGTWTLPFEVRLARDGLQETDGAARIRAVADRPAGVAIDVETFGFMPLAEGTHLHIFTDALSEDDAIGGAPGVVEYPATDASVPAHGMAPMILPAGLIPRGAALICVAVAHPDHTVLAGRGDCAPLPRGY
jgi:hypothetical protein